MGPRRVSGAVLVLVALSRSAAAQPTTEEPSLEADAPHALPTPSFLPPVKPPAPSKPGPGERDIIFEATDSNAELMMRGPSGWEILCTGSCETRGLIGAYYTVRGNGVTKSKRFTMRSNAGPFRVHADVGSNTLRTISIVTAGAGGATMGVGAAVFMGSIMEGGGMPGSGLLVAAGATVLATGIVLMIVSKTRLSFGLNGVAAASRLHLAQGFGLSADGLRF